MMENRKNLRFTRKRFLAQLRENLKNSDTEDTAWFNLIPYKKEDPKIADTVEGLLTKAEKFWKIITIQEKRYSKDIKLSKQFPIANWFLLKVDRAKFTNLCHEYGIKGPNEEDEDDDDEFASLKESVKKTEKDTGESVKKMEISKDHRGFRIKINGKFQYSMKKIYGKRIYEIAKNGKSEVDFDTGKGVMAWFNSNADNPIYNKDKGGFKKTRILEYSSDFLYPSPNVRIVLKKQDATFEN